MEPANLEELFPIAYQELKRLAYSQLQGERPDHTLNPTGLVHEAYLNLARQAHQQFDSKGHFFSVASLAMRRVLVDYARKKISEKRGGGKINLTLTGRDIQQMTSFEDILHLNEALDQYSKLSKRGADIIQHWFFGGFKQEEIAAMMDISEATVRREWRVARAWLSQRLNESSQI